MTYGELQEASRELTAFLLGRGVRKGDKVALMLHNGYQTARLLLGVMYGGFTVAPLNLLAQRSQLAYVLEHSDTRLVFTSGEHEARVREALPAGADVDVVVIDPDAIEAALARSRSSHGSRSASSAATRRRKSSASSPHCRRVRQAKFSA